MRIKQEQEQLEQKFGINIDENVIPENHLEAVRQQSLKRQRQELEVH